MSLDIYFIEMVPTPTFSANITHNVTNMARIAGVYELLWEPESGTKARELIEPIQKALKKLEDENYHPIFKSFEPENGWGSIEDFKKFLETVLSAAWKNFDSIVEVSK